MNIVGKNLNLNDFRKYVTEYNFGSIKPTSIVLHHSWSPIKAGQDPFTPTGEKRWTWNGAPGVASLKKYYENKGWAAGPHMFIAEDGIWLFTPMNEVGIHAAEGNATWTRLGKDFTGFRGPIGSKLKSYSIGIEVVGDYDVDRWTGETLKNVLGVLKFLMGNLNISTESVYFHRDFITAHKSCPGYAITKDWLFAELAKIDILGNPISLDVQPSPWAKLAWDWQRQLGLDLSVLPHQKVEAEWIVTMLYKLEEARKAGRLL